uniref:Uncharacterized protein n=1 Tax=Arcella intermedia TaxID=1963864 RepID=A0A6B2L8G2_9EUKA
MAYMFYYLYKRRGDGEHLERAFHYLKLAADLRSTSKAKKEVTFLCGDAGFYVLKALCYYEDGNQKKVNYYIDQLKSLGNLKVKSCEILYGWSGYLYSLLLLNKHIPNAIDPTYINTIANKIISLGLNHPSKPPKCPLMYSWPTSSSKYLGAAHGLSGILYHLMHVPGLCDTPKARDLVKGSLDYLKSIVSEGGNWEFFVPQGEKCTTADDDVAQWCHGAVGFTFMWARAYEVFQEKSYLEMAEMCANLTWEKGLIRKGRGLCHGISGNGYVFIELYKLTRKQEYWDKAIQFLAFCWSEQAKEMYTPDCPYSLFEGVAAIPFYVADVLDPLHSWGFPGYGL